jgi:hypothetical protein
MSGYGVISEVPVVQVLPVEGTGLDVIQATKREPRIMRYELTDFEWAAITSFCRTSRVAFPVLTTGAS